MGVTSRKQIAILAIIALYGLSLPFKNSIYQVSLFLMYASVFFFPLKKVFNFKDDWLMSVSFMVIFLSMTLSNIFGVSYGYGFNAQVRFFYYFIPLFFVYRFFLKENIVTLKQTFLILLSAVVVTMALGLIELHTVHYDFAVRLSGSTFSPNAFSVWLMIGIIGFTHLFLTLKSKYLVIATLLLLLLACFELLLTQSRAAWLGTLVGIIFYIVIFWQGICKKRFYGALAIMSVLIILFVLNNDFLQDRLHSMMRGDTSRRAEIVWPFVISKIFEAPLFGYGLDSMRLLNTVDVSERMPHNIYLEILLFLGISGFLAFGLFFVRIGINIKKVINIIPAYGAVLAGVMVSFLVDAFFDQSITMSLYFVSLLMIVSTVSSYLTIRGTAK